MLNLKHGSCRGSRMRLKAPVAQRDLGAQGPLGSTWVSIPRLHRTRRPENCPFPLCTRVAQEDAMAKEPFKQLFKSIAVAFIGKPGMAVVNRAAIGLSYPRQCER